MMVLLIVYFFLPVCVSFFDRAIAFTSRFSAIPFLSKSRIVVCQSRFFGLDPHLATYPFMFGLPLVLPITVRIQTLKDSSLSFPLPACLPRPTLSPSNRSYVTETSTVPLQDFYFPFQDLRASALSLFRPSEERSMKPLDPMYSPRSFPPFLSRSRFPPVPLNGAQAVAGPRPGHRWRQGDISISTFGWRLPTLLPPHLPVSGSILLPPFD